MHNLEIYPFWQMTLDQRLVVRFLPDLNERNNFGFVDEYHFHRVNVNGKMAIALCSEMHEDKQPCYHCVAARKVGKRNNSTPVKHWRLKQYIGNVIIIEDPLGVVDLKNPKTYKLAIGKQLFRNLKDELISGKIEELPSDYYNGNNFVITCGTRTPHPKYTGTFQQASKLNAKQVELAEESLVDLSELRPKLYSSSCQTELGEDLCWEILCDV